MKKKALAVVFCLAMVMSLALVGCGGGGSSAGGGLKDGSYTGSGKGMGGTIEVTLTVSGGKISDVAITDPGETAGVGGKEAIADGTYKDQIIAAQSADIEGVSGATITSTGVKDATQAALDQAK